MTYIPENFTPSTIESTEYTNHNYFTETINYVSSRNLKAALSAQQYYNIRRTIQYFVETIEHSQNLKISPLYAESVKINNAQCQTTSLKQLLKNHNIYTDPIYQVLQQKELKLNIIYVTNGYTFLKHYLQENNYPRYKTIENFIFTNTVKTVNNPAQYHCIITKYYKPEECIENLEDYVIILTEVNQKIIDKITYALPLFATSEDELNEITPVLLDTTNEQEFIKNQTISPQNKLKSLLKAYVENMFSAFDEAIEYAVIQNFYRKNFKDFVEYGWAVINSTTAATIKETFITNLQTAYQRNILGDLNNKIPTLDSQINRTLDSLNRLYAEKEKVQKRLALQTTLESDAIKNIFDTLDYFKQIKIKNITNNTMRISITGPLLNYDADALTTFLNNPTSYYNSIIRNATAAVFELHKHTIENVQTLLKEILLDQKYTILIQQDFKIYISNETNTDDLFSITAIREADYYDQLPNPHIYTHNCYGAARDIISQALHQQDFETVFGQLIYASLQFSVEDSTVFNTLLNNLFKFPHKTIQDNSTKELYTFKELLDNLE